MVTVPSSLTRAHHAKKETLDHPVYHHKYILSLFFLKRGDTISTFKALFLINTLPFNPNSGSVLANPILFQYW
ncbi:MAG: hypothetical protein CM15mP104_2040 [Gammaproteobacteria bacterium]|nr:MAG: hypothetical protein CM15mP104_2040 [Gammaproteobacteria bacterium]